VKGFCTVEEGCKLRGGSTRDTWERINSPIPEKEHTWGRGRVPEVVIQENVGKKNAPKPGGGLEGIARCNTQV